MRECSARYHRRGSSSAAKGASGFMLVFAGLSIFSQLFLTDQEKYGRGVSGKVVS